MNTSIYLFYIRVIKNLYKQIAYDFFDIDISCFTITALATIKAMIRTNDIDIISPRFFIDQIAVSIEIEGIIANIVIKMYTILPLMRAIYQYV